MVKLIARTPLNGLDLYVGTTRLHEVDLGQITSVSVAAGTQMSPPMPAPGRIDTVPGGYVIWTAQDQAFFTGGPAPQPDGAALSDQSDAWAVMELQGPDARAALTRLTALDLRASAFGPGQTARTALQHMAASLSCLEPDRFLILVFRSMARTAVHDLETAMSAVSARHDLPDA